MLTRTRACSLSLPFDILSEMRVVESRRRGGGTKESEDIGPSRKKGNYQDIDYYYVSPPENVMRFYTRHLSYYVYALKRNEYDREVRITVSEIVLQRFSVSLYFRIFWRTRKKVDFMLALWYALYIRTNLWAVVINHIASVLHVVFMQVHTTFSSRSIKNNVPEKDSGSKA